MIEIEFLYESFKTVSLDLQIDRDELRRNVKKLDIGGHELIYGLVKVHSMKNEGDIMRMPYGCKKMRDGNTRFDLNNFDDGLVRILQSFCNRHLVKMEESVERIESMI
jgi:hypothetical protein